MSRILVTGATGPLGNAVVDELLTMTTPDNISILARDGAKAITLKQKGVHVHIGDYNDYDSLVRALKGIDKLYFVSGSDLINREKQHKNVVNAAGDAGVRHIFYTSFQRQKEDISSSIFSVMKSHLATEKEIIASGLTYTILKHGVYTDMLLMYLGTHFLESQTIVFPAGYGKVSYATRNDMAAAGARVLLDTRTIYDNRTLEISGSEALSFHDIADCLGRITGKPFHYLSPDMSDFSELLAGEGVPNELIQLTCAFAGAIANDEVNCPDPTLEEILGRNPESVPDFLSRVYQLTPVC